MGRFCRRSYGNGLRSGFMDMKLRERVFSIPILNPYLVAGARKGGQIHCSFDTLAIRQSIKANPGSNHYSRKNPGKKGF